MTRKLKPLIQFNADYYKYPNSIRSHKYPLETELTKYEKEAREKWIRIVRIKAGSNFHRHIEDYFSDPKDKTQIERLLGFHGIFAEKFFHRAIRERVTRQLGNIGSDLKYLESLMSGQLKFYGKADAIYRIIDHIFEQYLVQLISDPVVYQKLTEWFELFSVPKSCILCGNEFRVIDLPDWIYYGSNGYKNCCFQCQIIESPKKAELFQRIPEFVELCGFIPRSEASPINLAFTSRLSSEQWAHVFAAFGKMGGIEHVKKKFKSWFHGLAETGSLPENVFPTARGVRCLANDGHLCHSLDEQRIDNWLSANHLPHEREPQYPTHPELNPTGRRRADWLVYDSFIEYFGLVGDSGYEKKMGEKILLAQESGIELIAIYPSDIENLELPLGNLLLNRDKMERNKNDVSR